jgi:hypothetical protein
MSDLADQPVRPDTPAAHGRTRVQFIRAYPRENGDVDQALIRSIAIQQRLQLSPQVVIGPAYLIQKRSAFADGTFGCLDEETLDLAPAIGGHAD